jgi:hypothetical protein
MVVPFGDGVSSHLAAPLRRGFFGRLPLPKLNRSRIPNAAAQTRIVSKARIRLIPAICAIFQSDNPTLKQELRPAFDSPQVGSLSTEDRAASEAAHCWGARMSFNTTSHKISGLRSPVTEQVKRRKDLELENSGYARQSLI